MVEHIMAPQLILFLIGGTRISNIDLPPSAQLFMNKEKKFPPRNPGKFDRYHVLFLNTPSANRCCSYLPEQCSLTEIA
jgi:hypothetical protein